VSIRFSPLCETFGVEVHGLHPRSLGTSDEEALRAALAQHAVLLVRDLELSPVDHVGLTRVFGEPDVHPIESIRMAGHPEIIVLAVDARRSFEPGDPRGDEIVGRIPWHSDLTYTALPSRGALLYARVVPPEGGDTGYADTAAVYAALPGGMKQRIEGLKAVHSLVSLQHQIDESLAEQGGRGASPQFEEVTHALVHRHPETGHRVLNISPAFTRSIEGLPSEESTGLLEDLRSFAKQDCFAYFHAWRPGDLVIWDNWRTMHVATGHKKRYARLMHRTTLRGGVALSA
jgi:taurine dioxygenase